MVWTPPHSTTLPKALFTVDASSSHGLWTSSASPSKVSPALLMASDDFLCLLPPDLRAKIQAAYPPCPARPWPTLVPGLVPAAPAAQAQCTAACELLGRMLMLSPARRITAAAVRLS